MKYYVMTLFPEMIEQAMNTSIMGRAYWQTDRIGMLTDHLNANKHAHWMLQLF